MAVILNLDEFDIFEGAKRSPEPSRDHEKERA